MAKTRRNYKIGVVIITLLLVPNSRAQRPSFAGSRPPNGLNQKDKYYSTTPANTDIQNRFGNADVPPVTNQIPFGQTQAPPVGYPIVYPETVYTVLVPPKPLSSNDINPGVIFEDRFDKSDTNKNNISSSSTTQRSIVPLDAHGDHLLVDQLNRIPIDKRPFWFINYQAIEAQRNGTFTNFAGAQNAQGSFSG